MTVRHGLRAGGLLAVAGCAHPAAAHGGVPTGATGLEGPAVVAVVAAAGVLAGTAVVVTRERTATGRYARHAGRLVGPVLVCVGATAALSAVFRRPAMGLGGVALGLAVGAVLASRSSHSARATVTAGTVALHRFTEGVALATLTLVGPAVTAFGVAVLAGHTVLECVAVAGQQARPVAALAAVCAVSGTFVLGVAAGAAGLLAVPVSRAVPSAVLGGALLAFALRAFRRGNASPACDRETA